MDHHNTARQVRRVHMNDMPNCHVNRKCTQSVAGNLIHSDGVRIDERVLYSTWVLPPTNVPKTRARPKCQCRCGCRRRPGRRIACPGCGRECGPGCGPQMCFDPSVMRRCHECQQEPEPEPRQQTGDTQMQATLMTSNYLMGVNLLNECMMQLIHNRAKRPPECTDKKSVAYGIPDRG